MCAVHRASMVCMMAGSDFIKTSTGKEKTNATIPVRCTDPLRLTHRPPTVCSQSCDGASTKRVPATHWLQSRLQTSGRNIKCQNCSQLHGNDEGRARCSLPPTIRMRATDYFAAAGKLVVICCAVYQGLSGCSHICSG